MSDVVIRIENLVCEAGGRTTLAVPRLSISSGERVAIVGHNGAGKSTLLRVLSGFTTPASGCTSPPGPNGEYHSAQHEDCLLRVLGRELGPRTRGRELRRLRTEIGQVMQGLHLVQRLTARENVLIGALGRLGGVHGWRSWARLPRAEDGAEAARALAAVGLAARADERTDHLSGGERQKVAIARMLMQRPRLILADEPTASLDPAAAREICKLLVRAAAGAGAGATLLSVVHNTALLPLLADRVIGLRQGRCVFDLPLAAVNEATLAALYVAEPIAAAINQGTLHAPHRGEAPVCGPICG